MTHGHGGARAGAGRPAGSATNPERAAARADFETERAEHERVKRLEREWEFAVKRGEYLPRVVQQSAAATALAVLTQALRSIPDNLERSLGLAPEAVEMVAQQIDDGLAEVAAAFRAMTND